MPPLDPDEYLPELMNEIGPVRSSGTGLVATDWPVIVAFAQVKGLDESDIAILAAMCRAYSQEFAAADSPLRIAPVDRTETDG